jgi:DNA polymerase I-like protein with 3'-5' exonuclease and polymerase domains
MIDIDRAFKGTNLKVLVQVHDELVAVAPEDEAVEMQELFIKAMGHDTIIQGVPLRVSCDMAATWGEAKG